MPKAKRRRVGDFCVGDIVVVNGDVGRVVSFPTRRAAVVEFDGHEEVVSTLGLVKRGKQDDH